MSEVKCKYCDTEVVSGYIYSHYKTKKCTKKQVEKLGYALKDKAKKLPACKRDDKKEPVIEDEISHEEGIDEIPLTSESSESDNDDKNPSKFNNIFKKKQSTIKTEIIRNDQPSEVHMRKEFLPKKQPDITIPIISTENNSELTYKFNSMENVVLSALNKMEAKNNSMMEMMSKMTEVITMLEGEKRENEKIIKSLENKLERDDKIDNMFSSTRKILAEVESNRDLLDIFRENMEDIIDKHYDLYKKFKYVKEDMEDMVYDKGSQTRSSKIR
jgi:hypothetical protein